MRKRRNSAGSFRAGGAASSAMAERSRRLQMAGQQALGGLDMDLGPQVMDKEQAAKDLGIGTAKAEALHWMDDDGDGKVSKEEEAAFKRKADSLDADGDGIVTNQEKDQYAQREVEGEMDTARLLKHAVDANGMISTARSEFKEVHRRMKNTRAERVNLKADSNILANRIKILKLEEQRAWARIQQSRERAKKILIIQQDLANRGNQREADLDFERRRKRAQQMNIKAHRELVRAQIIKNREEAERQKALKVKLLKDQKARNQEDIEAARYAELQKALHNTRVIKEQRDIRRRKLSMMKADQIQKVKQAYEVKVLEEEVQRKQEEDVLMKLEQEEMELIGRLRNTAAFAISYQGKEEPPKKPLNLR